LQHYWTRLPDSKREELVNAIQGQEKLLEHLVESILDLSRLDAGVTTVERQPVNLVELTDELVADLRSLADVKKLELRWTKPRTEIATMADPDQMRQVVRNLIDNAIKYTPDGGSVDVQIVAKKADGRTDVRIRVADTGIGIAPEHQGRVFERFYRADPSHTIPGTGLGLAIVKEIVTAHNGSVQLDSKPGKGSTFTVTLPGLEK
jgi:two-component system phosphate regulon sensor histidine kinase PhoR